MASVISKRIVKPVNELDLEHPEENQIYEELSPLLSKIHRQNREIQNQLELAKQQQAEFSLITENMQEGLIVIDKYTMIPVSYTHLDVYKRQRQKRIEFFKKLLGLAKI